MAGVSPVLYSPTQQAYPTPSPFTNTSGSWSSSHPIFLLYSNLVLRFFSFLFSAVSAISLTTPLFHKHPFFGDYDELRYCFGVAILATLYSFSLLFKGLHDIAFKGLLISDNLCDSITFVFDQVTFPPYTCPTCTRIHTVKVADPVINGL
ncbi:CASP-like protein 4A4 [Magnolia sinica]|uniref:CASP-like protein 4A4 n=1 Tax=Magnolia sinica TaxID=86752 RepID=UPI00265A36D0|nr:CASP-like protein 4A4 [Magnolia sinica]